jgi:transcriptional regulator GlxA family with amidase domain
MTKELIVSSSPITIVIAVPPNAQSLDVAGPLDVFREASTQTDGVSSYDVKLMSMNGENVVRIGGITLVADYSINDLDLRIDTLLVAGTPDYAQAYEMTAFLAWLQRCVPHVRRYGSVCTGAFFLGAAGLLDGHEATTHWQHAAELAERCASARIMPDAIYIKDGPLYTSAGVTAGIDLALKFVEDDCGRDVALKIARRLVVFLRRPGGQSQFSAHLAAQIAAESRIQAVQHWILDHVDADLALAKLASRAAMSVRNFTRLFQSETGGTPADFVEMARVDAARRYLEESDLPLQRVATKCGFVNPDRMRRAFLRRLGIGPTDYRERFRA